MTKISEPDFVSYVKAFDVFGAVETFTSTHFDFSTHFDNYHVFHSPAIKLSARGRRSGGVAIFIEKTIMPVVAHIECGHDNMICIKISKDVAGQDRDLLFVAVYVPPCQSPYYKRTDTNCTIHLLEDFLVNLYQAGENAHFMVCGDFNARIGELNVLIDDDNNLFGDGVCRDDPRKSHDKNKISFVKSLLIFAQYLHCIPFNGNRSGDVDGFYTFMSDQRNSVIDYCVVS